VHLQSGWVARSRSMRPRSPSPLPGPDAYLLDEQVHLASSEPELVEGGQYMQLHIPPGKFK
jgi:hypothetical protein